MEEKKLPHDHGQSMERELEQMPSVDRAASCRKAA